MSVENKILVTSFLPKIEEARDLILQNLNTSKCEFELIEKWIIVLPSYIKFTLMFKGEIRSSDRVYAASISDINSENKSFFTAKLRYKKYTK